MKILSSDPRPDEDPRKDNNGNRSDDKSGGDGRDRIYLYGRRTEIKRISGIVRNTPDIRYDKVEALKRAVETGTYSIPSDKVAEKILEEIREDFMEL